jgi:hypothetical protein
MTTGMLDCRNTTTEQGSVTLALDSARIAELESLFPDGDLAEFIDGVVRDLAMEIENAAAAVANEDLATVVRAAHAARNHALMCGATELGWRSRYSRPRPAALARTGRPRRSPK